LRIPRTAIVATAAVGLVGLGGAAWAAETGPSAATPSAAQQAAPAKGGPVAKPMNVVPSTVDSGDWISLTGAGCHAGTTVILTLDTDRKHELGRVVADGGGHFKAHVQLRSDAPAGANKVWAACLADSPAGKQLSVGQITITG
jgi:hypothetical protein